MRITCWISKATNTHKQFVSYSLLFHCNNVCTNAPQCYVVRTLYVLFPSTTVTDWLYNLDGKWILCVLDRASSWYLNRGWPTRWHLLYYLLLNMFQTLIRPSSGACSYLLRCVGCTRIPHHQQTIPLHNTSTPQVGLHNATSSCKLLKMDVLTSEICWAVDNKASVM